MSDLPYRSPQIIAYTLVVTGTAVALVNEACAAVLLQADPNNSSGEDVLIGDADNQYIQLTAGQSVTLQVENASLIYTKELTGTPTLNYLILK